MLTQLMSTYTEPATLAWGRFLAFSKIMLNSEVPTQKWYCTKYDTVTQVKHNWEVTFDSLFKHQQCYGGPCLHTRWVVAKWGRAVALLTALLSLYL